VPGNLAFNKAITDATPAEITVRLSVCSIILGKFPAAVDPRFGRALSLHPNSLRYRLRRIAEATGSDPRTLAGLLELIAAARLAGPAAGRPDWSV